MASFQDWLAFAEDDLKNANILKDQKSTSGACFHAQQAAEKSLKALILSKGEEVPRVHNLGFLLEKLYLPELKSAGEFLETFYIEARYPDATPGTFAEKLPSEEEAEKAVECATKIINLVKSRIKL